MRVRHLFNAAAVYFCICRRFSQQIVPAAAGADKRKWRTLTARCGVKFQFIAVRAQNVPQCLETGCFPRLPPYLFTIFFTPCSGWPLAMASIPSAKLAGNIPQLDRTAARSGASAPDMTIILNVGSL